MIQVNLYQPVSGDHRRIAVYFQNVNIASNNDSAAAKELYGDQQVPDSSSMYAILFGRALILEISYSGKAPSTVLVSGPHPESSQVPTPERLVRISKSAIESSF